MDGRSFTAAWKLTFFCRGRWERGTVCERQTGIKVSIWQMETVRMKTEKCEEVGLCASDCRDRRQEPFPLVIVFPQRAEELAGHREHANYLGTYAARPHAASWANDSYCRTVAKTKGRIRKSGAVTSPLSCRGRESQWMSDNQLLPSAEKSKATVITWRRLWLRCRELR